MNPNFIPECDAIHGESNNHKHLYFDNGFTSIPLMRHLATKGIWCRGTVRMSCIPEI